MSIFLKALATTVLIVSATAQAADPLTTEKVKTGILPSGGLYSLYTVDCGNQSSEMVASMNSNRNWCIAANNEMQCFPRKQEAAARACLSGAVASADAGTNGDRAL